MVGRDAVAERSKSIAQQRSATASWLTKIMNMLELEQTVALEILRDAVRIARVVQAEITLGRWEKEDRTPVTVADLAVQAVVSGSLAEHFPEIPLMAEEGADELRQSAWSDLLEKVIEH